MGAPLTHHPQVQEVHSDRPRYRASCSCGWVNKAPVYMLPKEAETALGQARNHARDKGCGKQRFATRAEADEAVLRAKMARGLGGNARRKEDRAYECTACAGRPWHLTSAAKNITPGRRTA